ncbi:MAG TPA: hypothetical protein PKA95_18095 [Thermomicrobiales bacterium]|nr:hypothetical protein [Thermomicrobiales bacterium]
MPTPDHRSRLRRGVVAGLAGGAAFALVMSIDQRLSDCPADDYRMLADFGPFARWWPLIGRLVHAANSVAVGITYGAIEDRLRGPGWLRGLAFAMAENAILWPIIILIDRVHPAVKSGAAPRYNQPAPAALEVVRHAAYGIVLGTVYERLRSRT